MTSTYSIEITYDTGRTKSIPLDSKTQRAAIAELRKWVRDNAETLRWDLVFLGFYRAADGQRGYVNEDGFAPVGRPWNR